MLKTRLAVISNRPKNGTARFQLWNTFNSLGYI